MALGKIGKKYLVVDVKIRTWALLNYDHCIYV